VPSDPVTPSKPANPVRSYARAAAPSDDHTPVGPLRLMIAGDSISHEFAGDYTWRWRLWNEFKRQNTAVQFVGPRTGVTGAIPLPLVPWAGDHHNALGGTRLSYEVPNIQSQVQKYQPDVMLLMTGFNDLNHGSRMPTVVANMETSEQRLGWEAGHPCRAAPHPRHGRLPTTKPRTIDIKGTNAGYVALVNKFQSEGRPITLAHLGVRCGDVGPRGGTRSTAFTRPRRGRRSSLSTMPPHSTPSVCCRGRRRWHAATCHG